MVAVTFLTSHLMLPDLVRQGARRFLAAVPFTPIGSTGLCGLRSIDPDKADALKASRLSRLQQQKGRLVEAEDGLASASSAGTGEEPV